MSKSLLIIGQPRGLTTHVYDAVKKAVSDLKGTGVSAGEVLNPDHGGSKIEWTPQYTKEDTHYRIHKQKLKQYSGNSSYIIKDVTQPFSVLQFLFENPGSYNVLHVYRNPKECRICQKLRGWDEVYPEEWLLQFMRCPTVYYNRLIYSSDHLWNIVEDMGYKVKRFEYRDQKFRQKTKEVQNKVNQVYQQES